MQRIEAPVTGSVWKIECTVGDPVSDGAVLVVLESMKMEIPVEAEEGGTVLELHCAEGDAVAEGALLAVVG